jgi:hypothetical protein
VSRQNQRKLYVAATAYTNKPSDAKWDILKAAFTQEEFDRLEAETEPAAEAEQPALDLEDAGE